MVRDSNGTLLEVYHGSGAEINSFDPSFTGQGNDQYGSGFYFTTEESFANAYTDKRMKDISGASMEKPGGENEPTVVKAYVNIKHPIFCNGSYELNLEHVLIPNEYIHDIVKTLPTLYHTADNEIEPNPLSDYFDQFWESDLQTIENFEPLIKEMVDVYFQDSNLKTLDILFDKYGTELRQAVYNTLGYDGIIVNFENSQHIVAWFPEQIKDINNLNPQFTSSLMDENYKEYEKIISCNDNELESSEEIEWYSPGISI